jgi:glycosyltransferase involved in cell wall biosynthesis
VVGSSIPGVAEAVRDGETAMLCVPGDVAGFSHSLVEILLNRDVRDRMSTMSLRWAAEAFDPAAVCKKYFELLL